MARPSIKGTIFAPVAEEIHQHCREGRISEEKLAVALQPEDLELLEKKLLTSSWYPMETYARYLDLLCQVEGGGAPGYYERRGHLSARRLMDAGMYAQLDILGSIADQPERVGEDADARALAAYRSKLTVVLSLAGTIYNVGVWKVVEDPAHSGRVAIEIRDTSAYSDGMVGAIVGFLDECARSVSSDLDKLYRFERLERDRVMIYMLEDLAPLRRRLRGQ